MRRVPGTGDEEASPLSGGNVAGEVVRVGDTVRKPAGFWTPAVEALLSHLARAGFTGAPRPLGRDGEGRQVLEYVPGPMAVDQPWLDEAGLHRVGRLIRSLHDASAGFVPLVGGGDPVADGPRLRALADGYGLSAGLREDLPPLIGAHTRGMAGLLENGARTGVQPWARLHAEGHGEHWAGAADYIERNLPAWRRALG